MRIPQWPGEEGQTFDRTQSLFLRLLGLVFLFAFWSLAGQIVGLAGARGILPAAPSLASLKLAYGPRAYRLIPTLFWFGASDAALLWVCRLGMIAAVVLMAAAKARLWGQRLLVLFCYLLYLSIVAIGEPFTSFQWDALLLESAFLALFIGTPLVPSAFRLLVFRLMFESGCVKLFSGDANWRNLHALRFHFMTQPLPNPLAWYMAHAPAFILDTLTLLTLAIELAAPFLLFGPRLVRYTAAGLLIALQLMIAATGNYAFFNLLSIALCLWAFDDRAFTAVSRYLPAAPRTGGNPLFLRMAAAVVALVMLLGVLQVGGLFLAPLRSAAASLSPIIGPFEIVNSYGLFAVMTTTRPEIVFEGSNDGERWIEYQFRYKPGDVKRGLPLVAPFQPRLDWQLWFAALDGNYEEDRWTGNVAVRLLEGEPAVCALLAPSPFAAPPRFVRAWLYDYSFTSFEERRKTGAVWNRKLLRAYLPKISLDMVRPAQR